jgi:hypothetical protein
VNEVELEVTEEDSDPDEFNRTSGNYLQSDVSINYDE